MTRLHAVEPKRIARRWVRLPSRASIAAFALGAWFACAGAPARAQVAIPPLDAPVVDTTGTLDAAAIQRIGQRARDLQARKGSQIQVLVVPTTAPESIEQYAQRVFDAWRPGRAGVDDGVLLVVAKDDRKVRIQPGYGLEGAIPDLTAARVISEYLVPRFRAGDYAGGIDEATVQLVKLVDGEPLPEPLTTQDTGAAPRVDWVFALIAAFIAAQVARGIGSGLPRGARALLSGSAGGIVGWLFSSLLLVGGIGALVGVVLGLASMGGGRFARSGGWGGFGGGPWGGGGGSSSGSGGGWSGGGGMSGGGGASGSW